jgi:hypothetical protein
MEIKDKNHKLVTTKIVVPIDDIYPNQDNPNRMADFMYEKMKTTIEKAGLFGGIIVREYAGAYQIIDGEHRWKACKELGFTELPVENAGEMEDKEASFWLLYFNNTRGKGDILKEAEIIKQLEEGQMTLLPWEDDEIENRKKLVTWSIGDFNEQKEVKVKTKGVISIVVDTHVVDAWKHALEVGKKDKLSEQDIIVKMIDEFLVLREGREPGETMN